MNSREQEFYFESHGEQIRVCVSHGTDDRVPLLICGGFGVSLDIMDEAVEALHDSTVIRFDAPGIGGLFKRLPLYRFSLLVEILSDLLDTLSVEQVDVYGISWGGMLAQEFALTCPERCNKLILASTLPGFVSLPGNPFLHLLLHPGKWFLKKRYSRIASFFYGGKVPKKQWRDLDSHLTLYHTNLPGYLGQLSAALGWTSIHRLRKLKQPVLLLFGNDDPVIPLINAVLLNKIIPNAKLVVFECGHLFPWTWGQQVQREISSFRSDTNASSTEERVGEKRYDKTRTNSKKGRVSQSAAA